MKITFSLQKNKTFFQDKAATWKKIQNYKKKAKYTLLICKLFQQNYKKLISKLKLGLEKKKITNYKKQNTFC